MSCGPSPKSSSSTPSPSLSEIKEFSPRIYQEILKIVGETDVDEVPFHEFKEQALDVKGIIRSAEFSPYASVRIVAGSAF